MKPLDYYLEKYPLLADQDGHLIVLTQVKKGDSTFNRWLRPKYPNTDDRFKFVLFEYLITLPETLAIFDDTEHEDRDYTLVFNRTGHENLKPPTLYTDVHCVTEALPFNMFGVNPRTCFVSNSLSNSGGFIGKPLYFDFHFSLGEKDVTVTVNLSHDMETSGILVDVSQNGYTKSKRLKYFPSYGDLCHLEMGERDLKHYIIDYIENYM